MGSVLIDYAKKNKDFADTVLEILDKKLEDKDKKRLATVIDSLKNPVVDDDEAVDDVEHGKDEKQQENPVVVVPTEQQQKENPVAVGVQSEPPLTKFFNNAMTNV